MPLLAFADSSTSFVVTGGVFQDFAPSPFHMRNVLMETLRKMAIDADLEIVRPGYVPAGNGEIRVTVKPTGQCASALSLPSQGKVGQVRGVAISSHLSEQKVSERMANACTNALSANGLTSSFDIMKDGSSSQPGAALAIWTETSTGCRLGADEAGQRGRTSESIGRRVADSLVADLESGATVDRFLADQLVIFAAMAEGVSEFRIPALTDHVDANLWLVEEFGVRTRLEGQGLLVEGLGLRR
jgi:RNA 3'-terminal phosphate cyclase (ATP)